MNEMFEKVKNILMDEMQVAEDLITPDAELVNDLGVNSLELADLVLKCEEEFSIEIKDEDLPKFITVGDVAEYISQHKK